jgi:hypothetical protein
MGHYDLYGNSYPTRREALNAETAQCAAIDADIAYREIEQLRKQNPWIGHGDYPMHGGYESCCDTLAKIIEGEKGKEGDV